MCKGLVFVSVVLSIWGTIAFFTIDSLGVIVCSDNGYSWTSVDMLGDLIPSAHCGVALMHSVIVILVLYTAPRKHILPEFEDNLNT